MAAKQIPDDLILRTVSGPARFVAVDGVRYRIRRPEEFGLLEAHRLAQMQIQMGRYGKRAKLTKKNLPDLVRVLHDTTEMIVPDMPKAVLAKLGDGARMAIVNHFTAATRSQRETASPKKTRSGGGSHHGSNDSMGATHASG